MSEISILFVDDDPSILSSLRRMLHPLRREWKMHFATSGFEALELLDCFEVDVVVSDMRMPEMNGAELLTEVMKRHPAVVRLILSGHTERELAVQTVNVAHQFLSKPCGFDELTTTIRRALALRRLLADKTLQQLAGSIGPLPSVPELYTAITRELNSADPSFDKIVEIISRDVPMTATVLRLVNSGFFGLPAHVTSVRQATEMLGIELLQALAISSGVFTLYTGSGAFTPASIGERATRVGALARLLAIRSHASAKIVEQSLLGGMLGDMGLLILHTHRPRDCRSILAEATEKNVSTESLERAHLGATHAELGAFLLGLWSFDDEVLEAVAHHHHPSQSEIQSELSPLLFVHLADALLAESGDKLDPHCSVVLDEDFLKRTGTLDRLPEWRDIAADPS